MTTMFMSSLGLEIRTERQRMILGWLFAGSFFLLAFISSFAFGTPDGNSIAPGVLVMVVVSSLLTVLSVYIYYVSNPEVEE
jgi:hypothetical protein